MTQKFVNNFAATVAQTFGAADTYLYINNAAPLGTLTVGEYYLLTVFRKTGVEESGHEVVKVTAITDNMLTVERSAEGAAASLFNVGDHVECRVTAKGLTDKADSAHHHDSSYEPKNANIQAHIADTANPHGVTKAQVGLSNVDNTSDADKPVSTAQQAALDGKEPNISAGTASQYWRGDKSWRDFFTDVRAATLTGLSTATNAVISATDTVLAALGKLQAQISERVTGQSSSVDGEVALFAGTDGKTVKRATGSGLAKLTSGVLSTATAGTDYVTPSGTETLTNKTLSGAILNDGYTEEIYALSGTTPALNPANGSIQTWTLSGNSSPTDSLSNGQSIFLGITASSYTVTWPSVTWNKVGGSGTAPTLTSSGVNWVVLWKVGGTLRGAFLGTA